AILGDIWVIETTRDAEAFETKRLALAAKFARVEAALGDGPWFGGAAFGLVDAVFAPVFRYFDVFDTIADLDVLESEVGRRELFDPLGELAIDRLAAKAADDDGDRNLAHFTLL
ncbi:glutathione S-transferase family protein, partial [Escherichia coli]